MVKIGKSGKLEVGSGKFPVNVILFVPIEGLKSRAVSRCCLELLKR